MGAERSKTYRPRLRKSVNEFLKAFKNYLKENALSRLCYIPALKSITRLTSKTDLSHAIKAQILLTFKWRRFFTKTEKYIYDYIFCIYLANNAGKQLIYVLWLRFIWPFTFPFTDTIFYISLYTFTRLHRPKGYSCFSFKWK